MDVADVSTRGSRSGFRQLSSAPSYSSNASLQGSAGARRGSLGSMWCDGVRHGDLTVLDLGNNGLTAAGAGMLTRLLSLKRSFKELNLYMNDIGDAGVAKALLDAGATLRGKTHMDELAYSLNGENAHYGTPRNPAAPGRIPGGSSSGSASLRGQRAVPSLRSAGAAPSHSVPHAVGDGSASTSQGGVSGGEAIRTVAAGGSAQDGSAIDSRLRARRRTSQVASSAPAAAPVPPPVSDAGIPAAGVAVAALAGLGVLAALYKKFFAGVGSQAVSAVEALPQALAQGIQQKKLQKDAQGRLNEMCDQLRSVTSVDLSAKNLGDEGTAYVVEALAFNTHCRALDLSKNGVGGGLGAAALTQVLPSAVLETLVLNTNSLGDGGAEQLAKALAVAWPGLTVKGFVQRLVASCGLTQDADSLEVHMDKYVLPSGATLGYCIKRYTPERQPLGKGRRPDARSSPLHTVRQVVARAEAALAMPPGLARLQAEVEAAAECRFLPFTFSNWTEAWEHGLMQMAVRLSRSLLPARPAAAASVLQVCSDLLDLPTAFAPRGQLYASLCVLRLHTCLLGVSYESATDKAAWAQAPTAPPPPPPDAPPADAAAAPVGSARRGRRGAACSGGAGAGSGRPTGGEVARSGRQREAALALQQQLLDKAACRVGPVLEQLSDYGSELSDMLEAAGAAGAPAGRGLTTLKMGWCKVAGGDGARALSDLLLLNSTLSALDLRGNSLGNDGAILLSRGLKAAANAKLAELDLGYNEIKDDGACALAQALKANPEGAPRELKLNSNYITRFGQVALSEAVDMVFEMGAGKMTTVHF
ncbi:Amidase 1 [Tetrabaena socialis]|uniref:Amidase 1 n=1 Tax=Tetrabaena socialis TaxID=47790 RepID=A0A2J8A057_9CHLO|nr:Amidase 1 [Tetrabaena socialis]|eukprot:PNH05886.1 Amidase 1 [Tetrabaena socialis]